LQILLRTFSTSVTMNLSQIKGFLLVQAIAEGDFEWHTGMSVAEHRLGVAFCRYKSIL
jgi:hypothetical protein